MTMERSLAAQGTHAAHDGEDDALALAARTDTTAFARLYERHYAAVYRYCTARAANPEDAADLAQHVFTVAFARRRGFRPGGAGFLAWLLRIARNAAVDASRRRGASPPPLSYAGLPLVSHAAGPEDAALVNERISDLRKAIEGLPRDQQEALELRFGAGLSIRAIGHVMGVSQSAAQMRLWRALNAIRKEGQ